MPMLQSIFILLFSLLALQTSDQEEKKLPEWTNAPAESSLFVVQTEEFSNHLDVTDGLLPAVKKEVSDWARRTYGAGCDQVVGSMPLEEFRKLIYENQEIVHEFRRVYDKETAKRLEAEYDIYYRGYVRVSINDAFRDQVKQGFDKFRLTNRLCTTLVSALFIFGLMGIAWGYLSANRVSRGFYISRLRWITGGLLIALIFVCYSVASRLF